MMTFEIPTMQLKCIKGKPTRERRGMAEVYPDIWYLSPDGTPRRRRHTADTASELLAKYKDIYDIEIHNDEGNYLSSLYVSQEIRDAWQQPITFGDLKVLIDASEYSLDNNTIAKSQFLTKLQEMMVERGREARIAYLSRHEGP